MAPPFPFSAAAILFGMLEMDFSVQGMLRSLDRLFQLLDGLIILRLSVHISGDDSPNVFDRVDVWAA